MIEVIEILISLFAIFGIVFITASFFESYYVFGKIKNKKKDRIDIYVYNEDIKNKVIKEISNSKELNKITNEINIYIK